MTDQQREVYMLLCMTGRAEEAEQYRAKCEAACKDETDSPASLGDGSEEDS